MDGDVNSNPDNLVIRRPLVRPPIRPGLWRTPDAHPLVRLVHDSHKQVMVLAPPHQNVLFCTFCGAYWRSDGGHHTKGLISRCNGVVTGGYRRTCQSQWGEVRSLTRGGSHRRGRKEGRK
eukprot:9478329-Pyramimonas_sp.AAC.3